MKQQIELVIADYLSAVKEAHGQDQASRTHIRHVGGTDFVIEKANGKKLIVDIGLLRLMIRQMKDSSLRKKAA